MTKRALGLLLVIGSALFGCAATTEDPAGDEPAATDEVSTSEDALTVYKKFTQRYLCRTTPQDPNVFCKNKGYDGGSIYSTSSCFRIDDFSVKDVVYNCRVRT